MTTYLDDTSAPQHYEPPPRDRTYEGSEFVAESVTRWLVSTGATVLRVHPQELVAGKTPIGIRVRIRFQAARTPIQSSLDAFVRRERIDPMLSGYPLALALPDLPRLRREQEALVAALPPERWIHWIFVGRYGQIDVVPPPRHEREAADDAETADQSSIRSGSTA
ncbi:MAG: hypothetical protein IT460_05075 [Planctomycetes bacterium]|nr:hypothetical protein [Planctomycetota bacterium]